MGDRKVYPSITAQEIKSRSVGSRRLRSSRRLPALRVPSLSRVEAEANEVSFCLHSLMRSKGERSEPLLLIREGIYTTVFFFQ